MPADKPKPTLADYVTMAISPALVMAMIDSLVFFLLALFYRGEYVARLHWILFFYVFGIVLVARIAMETSLSERAPLYGIVLAVLVWLGMGALVDYPREVASASWLINASLIGLAWWLSYQLTYSCTYIDEKAESTGVGVLQAAGLEKSAGEVAEGVNLPEQREKRDKKPRLTWWQRYQRFRKQRKKSQPPGVWVVYFALGALPIFGLGQALIDLSDVERRTHAFLCMTMYLASALGLLVTTAFLGLRRYLRQRGVGMPRMVTLAWLVLGAVLVAAFVGIGAILPRPQAEFGLLNLSTAASDKLAASKHAVTNGEPGEGEGRAGAQKRDPEGAPAASTDKSNEGKGGQGQAKGPGSGPKQNQAGGAQDDSKGRGEQRDAQAQAKDDPKGEAQSRDGGGDQPGEAGDNSAPAEALSWLPEAMSKLKWLVFGLLALITLIFALRGGLHYLAHFTDWAHRLLDLFRHFWEGLFGSPSPGKATRGGSEANPDPAGMPFSAYANPFQTGQAARMTPADLARYSFEALEAWAGEREMARRADESPIEFTQRLADEVPFLESDVPAAGFLYARVLYAPGELPANWSEVLKRFWKRLDAMPAEQASSLASVPP